MKNLRTEEEIMQDWQGDRSSPLLSIVCNTYNHEKFIEDALGGFLVQETDFPFEILVHDDASTDGTADVIRAYETHYPNLVKPIYQEENQYSKGLIPGQLNRARARGAYIAFCEGDDFWVDPKKLQIQVDFLEAHPDYVISGHGAMCVDEKGIPTGEPLPFARHRKDFSGEELMFGKGWFYPLSWVFRDVTAVFPPAPEARMFINRDNFFLSRIGHFGKGKYHHDIQPACYRIHPGGLTSMKSLKERYESAINSFFWIYRYYKRIGDHRCAEAFWKMFVRQLFRRLSSVEMIRGIAGELFVRVFFMRQVKRRLPRVRYW